MRRALLPLVPAALCACSASQPPIPSQPEPASAIVDAPAELDTLQSTVMRTEPNPEAPSELKQYGRLVGEWSCSQSSLQPDGSWKDAPALATWTWFYTLDGHAVQDVWQTPPELGGGVGTNIRVYDPEQNQWDVVWTTNTLKVFDRFVARFENGDIVMHGDLPNRAPGPPAHKARITFHSIQADSFDWRYDASGPNDGTQWAEQARMHCDRSG